MKNTLKPPQGTAPRKKVPRADRLIAKQVPRWEPGEDIRVPKVVPGWAPPRMVCVRLAV